jgi:hypothetical protein
MKRDGSNSLLPNFSVLNMYIELYKKKFHGLQIIKLDDNSFMAIKEITINERNEILLKGYQIKEKEPEYEKAMYALVDKSSIDYLQATIVKMIVALKSV